MKLPLAPSGLRLFLYITCLLDFSNRGMRTIDDILNFRGDIPPFLVHLTRDFEDMNAKARLNKILEEQKLRPSDNKISDAKFGIHNLGWAQEKLTRYFGAVCFTETPLNEIHCLLEIQYRNVNLQPYGLVFLKEKLKEKSVGPVFYFNNEYRDKTSVIRKLCELIESDDVTDQEAAARLLPMISNFGNKITPINNMAQDGRVDFLWEREWRLASIYAPLNFDLATDVFIGLCPHTEIEEFELAYPNVMFIDPRRNTKWYATKLIEARQRLNLKVSVV
ncbi:MAG: hypothetical protein PHG25_00045 [Candidatus Pacebacteria bacterium]|nr:hypothetical protein [Candidatus Paceibacterota bacterium]